MKKVFLGAAAGILALSISAGSVFGAVNYDATTGTGFVGKGDVQTVLGFNNAEMQKLVADKKITFTTETVKTYEITVEWTTAEGKKGQKTHTVEHTRTSTVDSNVAYEARQQKQYTGFNLTGNSTTTEQGNIPKVDEEFPGESGHIVTAVELVSSSITLKVNGVALQ